MKQLPAATGWVHAPDVQTSVVHPMPSDVHAVASGLFVMAQPPDPSQMDAASHSVGAQAYVVPWHVPLVQTSFFVQPWPSSQDVPFAAVGFVQAPVDGLQAPAMWHW